MVVSHANFQNSSVDRLPRNLPMYLWQKISPHVHYLLHYLGKFEIRNIVFATNDYGCGLSLSTSVSRRPDTLALSCLGRSLQCPCCPRCPCGGSSATADTCNYDCYKPCIQGGPKNHTKLTAIVLSNLNRFSFFIAGAGKWSTQNIHIKFHKVV